jgi:HEAT repeat protein
MNTNREFADWQQGMDDHDPNVRIRHAGKWINWQALPKAAIPVLTKALADEDFTVRSYAAGTLCVHEVSEALAWDALRRVLQSKDTNAVVEALSILSDFISPIPVLAEVMKLFQHLNSEVRKSAIQALRRGIQEAPTSQRQLGSASKKQLEHRFPGIMNALVPIQELLADPEKEVRMEAANALFCFGPLAAESLPVFLEWAKSLEDEIRELGVKGLYYVGRASEEANKVLKEIWRNPNDPWHNSVRFWLKERR